MYHQCVKSMLLHCVEDLLNIQAPERAQYIRVMFAEVTRILNHLLNIPAFAMDIGAATPMLWAFEEREKCWSFMRLFLVLVSMLLILDLVVFIKIYLMVF